MGVEDVDDKDYDNDYDITTKTTAALASPTTKIAYRMFVCSFSHRHEDYSDYRLLLACGFERLFHPITSPTDG